MCFRVFVKSFCSLKSPRRKGATQVNHSWQQWQSWIFLILQASCTFLREGSFPSPRESLKLHQRWQEAHGHFRNAPLHTCQAHTPHFVPVCTSVKGLDKCLGRRSCDYDLCNDASPRTWCWGRQFQQRPNKSLSPWPRLCTWHKCFFGIKKRKTLSWFSEEVQLKLMPDFCSWPSCLWI